MVRFLSNLFSRRRPMLQAERARLEARQAWDNAKRAGDTRRQHETLAALQAATDAALRAELGL